MGESKLELSKSSAVIFKKARELPQKGNLMDLTMIVFMWLSDVMTKTCEKDQSACFNLCHEFKLKDPGLESQIRECQLATGELNESQEIIDFVSQVMALFLSVDQGGITTPTQMRESIARTTMPIKLKPQSVAIGEGRFVASDMAGESYNLQAPTVGVSAQTPQPTSQPVKSSGVPNGSSAMPKSGDAALPQPSTRIASGGTSTDILQGELSGGYSQSVHRDVEEQVNIKRSFKRIDLKPNLFIPIRGLASKGSDLFERITVKINERCKLGLLLDCYAK